MHARRLLQVSCLLVLIAAAGYAQEEAGPSPITLRSLLTEMTDVTSVARWPQPEYKVTQASSYNRKSVDPKVADTTGWFANGDNSHFLRTEDNGHGQPEYVMLDVDGPGALVRAWFTMRETTDTLRIYIDHAAAPAIQGTFQELISGHKLAATPLTIANGAVQGRQPGGLNIHLPIPYAKHCKVTWSQGNKQTRYYNIEYRTYSKGTPVKSFSPAELRANRDLVDRTAQTLLAPPVATGTQTLKKLTLPPGQSAAVDLPQGQRVVRALSVKIDPAKGWELERTLRGTVLSIRFDGQETVWVPVGDFFGSGVGLNRLESWYGQVKQSGTLSCRWPMPYRQSGRITLQNLNKEPVTLTLAAACDDWRWDDCSLYFHACWRQERGIPTRPQRDWNYVSVNGQGVYMGDSLAVFNPVTSWWGEGDEKIYQDGAPFPTHFGTGSEDYYGYAYCSTRLFHGPFSTQVRCDGPRNQGHTTVARTRSLDRIPFDKSLQVDIEVWHINKTIQVDYAVTSYWYGAPGASCNRTPQTEDAAGPISQAPAQ